MYLLETSPKSKSLSASLSKSIANNVEPEWRDEAVAFPPPLPRQGIPSVSVSLVIDSIKLPQQGASSTNSRLSQVP